MQILRNLAGLALRQVVDGACKALGARADVVGFLTSRFTDQSLPLIKALRTANERAWKVLGIALADEGRSPWHLTPGKLEVVVEAGGGGEQAWLPASPTLIQNHPSGRAWAGAVGGHFHLFAVEG
jgi:hypothetical protein